MLMESYYHNNNYRQASDDLNGPSMADVFGWWTPSERNTPVDLASHDRLLNLAFPTGRRTYASELATGDWKSGQADF